MEIFKQNYSINFDKNSKFINEEKLKPKPAFGEFISSLVYAITLATIVHTYFIQPFIIPTGSLEKSLLVGDFLFSRAFQLMTKYGNTETLKILADTSVVISEGEVLELANDKNLEINENIYFEVVNAKTASLFSAACQVGSISALGTEAEVNALKSFGTNFGMTFQLIDDAIDYSSNKKILGKNTGDDFKEGKITLPIILAYGRSNDKEKKFWERTISDLNQNDGDFEMALEIINKYQCIEDTLTRANHFSNVAVDSVDIFKDNIYKEKLVSLVSKSVSRIY